jgi:hypothetical protein
MSGDPSHYVHAFRRQVEAPQDSFDRNLAAIERRLAAGDVVDEDDEPRAPVQPRGRWAAALLVFKSVGLSVGLGVAGLGVVKLGAMTWYAAGDRAPVVQPRASPDEAPAPPRKAERAVAPPFEPAPPPAPAATTTPEEPIAPAPTRVSRPRAKAPLADRLRQEVDLLERARKELDAGRHAAVLDLVDEHEQRFPDGAMIEERRAWRAIATCSVHRADARTHAQAFLDRHPRSSLTEKVRRACADRLTDPAK